MGSGQKYDGLNLGGRYVVFLALIPDQFIDGLGDSVK